MIKAVIFDCTGVLVQRNSSVNYLLLAFIRERLKPHYKIGMLSNLSMAYVKQVFTEAELSLFDEAALASETGLSKPDPRAYRLIANRLQVSSSECIFVDDFERRCEAAREEGMLAVLYSSLEQVKLEIEVNLQDI